MSNDVWQVFRASAAEVARVVGGEQVDQSSDGFIPICVPLGRKRPTWDPISAEAPSSGAVEWVDDRWVIALNDAILVSPDAANWTQVPYEDTFDTFVWVNALTSGPTGVVASTCEGWGHHYVWFSEDGTAWDNTYVEAFHMETAYADGLGFVVVDGGEGGGGEGEGHQVTSSPDGRTWHAKTWHSGGSVPSWALADDGALWNFEIQNLAAFGQTVFVDHTEGALLLTYE